MLGRFCKVLPTKFVSKRIQLCEVQSDWLRTRACLNSPGTCDGSCLAVGICERNNWWLPLDSAFAALFFSPLICSAKTETSQLAKKRNRLLNKCRAQSYLLLPKCMIATTDALSHHHLTILPCHWPPHIVMLTTTGSSSLIVMCSFFQEPSYCSWNQSSVDENVIPPQSPNASDVIVASHRCGAPAIMLTLFQFGRKHDHHWRSDLKA